MWDLSGGRRSPLPPAGPPPPFPVPQHHHSLPPGQPASNVATQGTSYPSLSAFGSSVPSTARSDSYGFNHASTSYEYQAPRGIAFPSSPSHHSPSHYPAQQQPAVVIHHSSHHSKSKHSSSHNRLRRHSHSGLNTMPVSRPSVPQVPIYTSGGALLKPALVHHTPSAQNLSSSYHRPSQSHNHVAFQGQPPKSALKKPSTSHSHSQSPSAAPHGRIHYSKCNGRRKALCIGINYTGHSNELRGCVNDAKRVRQFLIKNGYPAENIVLLSDDTRDPRSLPTRKNIIAAMKWLVRGAQPNDALFFHYSGHGGQTPDLDGDELDGFDEVIYPLDFKKNGHITDDEMHDLMVKPLPDDCRLTGLFDACHSGTVLDLPYIYSSHGRLKGSHITDRARRRKATNADVISWSGCKDGQTSADTFHGGVAVGAMSHAFVSALTANPTQSYQELLRSVRLILHPRYSQKPQLGSSHHIDTALRFVF